MNLTSIAVTLIAGYLLGSISFAHLLARSDAEAEHLHQHGAGASSVFWIHGPRSALLVVAGDFGKGVAAGLLAQWLFGTGAIFLAGTAAVIGHNWPVFYRFKGGRGVLTGAGVLLTLMPFALGLGLIVAVVTFVLSRNTLISSMALFSGALAAAWGFGSNGDVLVYAISLPGAVAIYTLLARRHVPHGERWHSTTLRP